MVRRQRAPGSTLIRCLHAISDACCDGWRCDAASGRLRKFPAGCDLSQSSRCNGLTNASYALQPVTSNILCLSGLKRLTIAARGERSESFWESGIVCLTGRIRGDKDVHGYCRKHLAWATCTHVGFQDDLHNAANKDWSTNHPVCCPPTQRSIPEKR